jgi:hypothetical protein
VLKDEPLKVRKQYKSGRAESCREIAVYEFLDWVGLRGQVSPPHDSATVNFSYGYIDIVMERGQDLDTECVLTPENCSLYAKKILNLYLVWSALGLYHFDLKLDNFVLMPTGALRVIDWGLLRTDCDRMYALDSSTAFALSYRHPDLIDTHDRPWGKEPYDCFELWGLCHTLLYMSHKCPVTADIKAFMREVFEGRCKTKEEAIALMLQRDLVCADTLAAIDTAVSRMESAAAYPDAILKAAVGNNRLVLGHSRGVVLEWLLEVVVLLDCTRVFGAVVLAFDLWCAAQEEPVPSSDIQLAAVCAMYLTRFVADGGNDWTATDYVKSTMDTYTAQEMRVYAQNMYRVVGSQMPWIIVVNHNSFARAAALTDMFGYTTDAFRAAATIYCQEVCADPAISSGAFLKILMAHLMAGDCV